MNGTPYSYYLMNRMNRLLKSRVWGVLLCLAWPFAAVATQPLYQNTVQNFYVVPGSPPPPNIDATAFDNESIFSIDFDASVPSVEQYETENTVFYTNNGTMIANTFDLAGTGFIFDDQTNGLHLMAGTFYNAGDILCASASTGFGSSGPGIFSVLATNIFNPGTVDVGNDGLIKFVGQNADFTRSFLNVEGTLSGPTGLNNQGNNTTSYFGTDSNQDWNPAAALQPTSANSSQVPGTIQALLNLPFLTLPISTPYFQIKNPTPTNTVIRGVFLMDFSPNVTPNVYFEGDDTNFDQFGVAGASHVEWVGHYLDPASGQTFFNYLYLTDDYLLGASTNVAIVNGNGNPNNGLPNNYSLLNSTVQQSLGSPITPGFTVTFPDGVITNRYSAFNAQLISTTIPTNQSLLLPNGALTNLPGRVQITANKDLNLTLVGISGPNYISLTSTNQFDGSDGAAIKSPFADINLAVTNGNLTIRNLLTAQIPAWSGTLTAWSTRWLATSTNTSFVVSNSITIATNLITITNDFRIELVSSQLIPFSTPQVQNLKLHSTNSVVISDALNIFGSIFIDSRSLTLTTNGPGLGANSLDGEINWNNTLALGAAQFPNLLWVTNNGAIRTLGSLQFGAPTLSCGAVINNSLISDQGAIIYATNFVNVGAIFNGTGGLLLQSQTANLTNGVMIAGASINIGTGTLLVSNATISAGGALNLTVTNVVTDSDATNGTFWSVGAQANSAFAGVYLGNGFNLPILPTNPVVGDLRHTTVTNFALVNRRINNLWAGSDRGAVPAGFTNNVAIGHLLLDATNTSALYYFSGTGTSGVTNAMYVDEIEFLGVSGNRDTNGDLPALQFNTNMVIYYAQAIIGGVSLAEKLNHHNGNHLRWVPTYAGLFSSTNLVYPAGVTNSLNAALVQSEDIDSDGDGTPNGSDPTPIFVPGQVNFTMTVTNVPPLKALITWDSIPAATNTVQYKTNLISANWLTLTNFVSPAAVPPPTGWPLTNVVFDVVNPAQPKFYRVLLNPNSLDFNGP